jgi:hypothetical protein
MESGGWPRRARIPALSSVRTTGSGVTAVVRDGVTFASCLGAIMMRTGTSDRDYLVVFRFATDRLLQNWLGPSLTWHATSPPSE